MSDSMKASSAWKTEYDRLCEEISSRAVASLRRNCGGGLIDEAYVSILREELIPATGCTEPASIALAAAKCRETLGVMPERTEVAVSQGVIRNTKSVTVPGTNGMKGIEAAAAAGIVAGKSGLALDVISRVSETDLAGIEEIVKGGKVKVSAMEDGDVFDIEVREYSGSDTAVVRITGFHTNIVLVEKNGKVLYEKPFEEGRTLSRELSERKLLTIRDIVDFAGRCDLSAVKGILEKQIECNEAVAAEGMKGNYGANIGRQTLQMGGEGARTKARAMAAAGSDARMNGCMMPVVINSGSGNQGITVSVPVIEYAKALHSDHDRLLRALIISNLISIHIHTGFGILSACCGAVSAGAAAGAGIAYLMGADADLIGHTVVNALATDFGVICDGAKSSCAAKISIAVESGILGYYMALNDRSFSAGDGIVRDTAEKTVEAVGTLASGDGVSVKGITDVMMK